MSKHRHKNHTKLTYQLYSSSLNNSQQLTDNKRLKIATKLFEQAELTDSFNKFQKNSKSFLADIVQLKHFIGDFHVGQFITGHGSYHTRYAPLGVMLYNLLHHLFKRKHEPDLCGSSVIEL